MKNRRLRLTMRSAASAAGAAAGVPAGAAAGGGELDASLIAALRAGYLKGSVEIWMDLGAGTLEQLDASEIGETIATVEDVEQYADEFHFQLLGAQWSPRKRALIRGKRRVELRVRYGAPGSDKLTTMFRGYTTAATFDDNFVADITALDESIDKGETLVSYTLEANSGVRRIDAFSAICTNYGVTIGTLDLGPNGETIITKPLSIVETKLYEALREIAAPCGAEVWSEDRAVVAKRVRFDDAIARTLTPQDIARPVTITLPTVAATNEYVTVSVRYAQTLPSGYRTETRIESTFRDYAPRVAVLQQNNDGTTNAIAWTYNETWREVARVVTTDTFLGSEVVRSHVAEYEWYARECARNEIHSDGTIHPAYKGTTGKSYQFADGSWRADIAESFRLVRETTVERTLDADLRIIGERESRKFWHYERTAIWELDVDGVTEIYGGGDPSAIQILENGEGVLWGHEVYGYGGNATIPGNWSDAERVTTIAFDASDDTITSETEVETFYSRGLETAKGTPGAWVYNAFNKEYWSQQNERGSGTGLTGRAETVTRYEPLTEETYRTIVASIDAQGNRERRFEVTRGTRPRVQRIEPETSSQEVRRTATDGVRAAISGTLTDTIHDENCQNDAELQTRANAALLDASAWPVAVPMPLDTILHKGRWVTFDYTPQGWAAERMRVKRIERDYRAWMQSLTLKFYPEEVQTLA